ncbi:MAG: hypothetical protein KDC44_08145, partial [Phaeodactylibacter sp.]|nr:hypothetical protein [Phaeodactylibacter sp.]
YADGGCAAGWGSAFGHRDFERAFALQKLRSNFMKIIRISAHLLNPHISFSLSQKFNQTLIKYRGFLVNFVAF